MFRSRARRALSFVVFSAVVAVSAQTRPEPGTPASDYHYITGKQRIKWFVWTSFGPESEAAGVITAGWGTLMNSPHEYGPHWDGFADRFGMRYTGVVVGKAMEDSLGAIWGEDPRYFPATSAQPFGARVKHVIKMTFMDVNRNGDDMPAYARFIAVPGNNFLSNLWREPSEANTKHALIRTADGFLGRMAGNAFAEFWPDVTHRKKSQ
jgi:hypothetical protein